MLDPWIIEQIRRREQEQRIREEPVLEIPADEAVPPTVLDDPAGRGDEEGPRGVIVIDFSVG